VRVWRTLCVAAVVGALALAGCGGADGRSAEPSGAGQAASGEGGLDFTVATLDGGTFDGTSLAGKPAVLWFWAPWCPTCVAQAPHVARIAADYAGRASVVGVAGLDKVQAMREFVALPKVSGIPHLADEQGVVWKRFKVTAQSTYVVLDAAGAVTRRGHLEPEQLRAELERLAGPA
jgi:thiol-disulfide isomerase/thioredoxin